MTTPQPPLPAPASGPRITSWQALLIGASLGAVFMALVLIGPGLVPRTPPTPTPPEDLAGHTRVWFRTTPEQGPVELAAPLRVQASVPDPPAGTGGRLGWTSVLLELRDATGAPAPFGPGPAAPQSMYLFDQPPLWTADLSAPTAPGRYHITLQLAAPDVPTRTLDLSTTVLTVISPPTPLISGFVYDRDGNLWLTSSDGTRTRKLTFYPAASRASEPAWSPDGSQIVYSRRVPTPPEQFPTSDLWSIRPDGSDNHLLLAHAPGEDLRYPAWAGDSTRLLFTVDHLIDPLTGTPRPADDPTGGRDQWNLEVVNADGSGRHTLLRDALMGDWSADGTRLVYLQTPPSSSPPDQVLTHTLMLAQADGTAPHSLVPANAYQDLYAPRLAPDGQQVAFAAVNPEGWGGPQEWWAALVPPVAANGVPWDIYTMPTVGGVPHRLTQMQADMPAAAWGRSPDRLATLTGVALILTPPDGRKPQYLAAGAIHGYLGWYDR